PSAAQAFPAGVNPAAARSRYGGWFGMLAGLGLLSPEESDVFSQSGHVLAGFETEPVNTCFRLVAFRALRLVGALRSGASVATIARVSRELILADPRLRADVEGGEFRDLADADPKAWEAYWRKWPIAAWSGELRGTGGRWFELDGNRLVPTFSVEPELGDAFDAMAAELVEYRLTRYVLQREPAPSGAWTCRVGH